MLGTCISVIIFRVCICPPFMIDNIIDQDDNESDNEDSQRPNFHRI